MNAAGLSIQKRAGLACAWLTHLLWFVCLAAAAAAATTQPLDREQALDSLSDARAQVRREAASRLGDVGLMGDTPALLQALRDADADTRERAEQSVWRIWARSGDRRVDRLYQAGVAQMNRGELRKGIATFTRIIRIKPEFAEGWNKRATLYFLAGDYRKSLADCAQVIKRNPYHFGALAGYGQLYLRLEDYQRSLEYFRRALAINPNMGGVELNILLLEQLIEERRKNMI